MIFSKAYLEHYKKTFIVAYPVMISQLGHVTVSLADSIMVGNTGTIPLAACAIATSIFTLFLVFGLGYTYGLTPLVAQEDGKKNFKECGILLEQSFLVNMAVSLVLFGLIYAFSESLIVLNQPPEVVALAKPFLQVIGFSIIPLMLFLTFKQFTEGLAFTKQAMYISIIANVLNVFLNYILIYGKLGFPEMGLLGAGYANLIARIFMAVAMAWYVLTSPSFKKYLKDFHWRNLELKIVKKLSSLGIPIGMQFLFEIGAFTGAAIMMGWIGADELAAHQVAISLAAVTYMAASGISSAATVRVGNAFGQHNLREVRMAGFSAYFMVILFMAVNGVIFILCNRIFPTYYVNDINVIGIASNLLLLAAFFQISDGVQVVGLGALRGMTDVKIPTIITLIAYWVLALPIGYLLGIKLGMGAEGIWLGLVIGLTVAAVFLYIRFYSYSKKHVHD